MVENYRPVSLTSQVCKILESIIWDELIQHFMDSGMLSDAQHGFVPGRSWTSQLLLVIEEWSRRLDAGTPVDPIYLDFKKPFVSVTHERLIITLSGPGIWSKLLNWIRCFLSGCSQRVVLHGCRSEWVDSPVESHRAVSWVQHSFCSCSLSAQGYKKRYNDICR